MSQPKHAQREIEPVERAAREWRRARGYCERCGACSSPDCCSPCDCEDDD